MAERTISAELSIKPLDETRETFAEICKKLSSQQWLRREAAQKPDLLKREIPHD
jgi:hypothetical protein